MKIIRITLSLVLLFFSNCDSTMDCSSYFESQMKLYCENIFNTTHTCQYSKSKCELKTKGCSRYTGKDESICQSMVPTGHISNSHYKCIIKDEVCSDVPKECSEHEEGITDCSSLDAGGDSKRCILNNGICESHYKTCDILGSNKESCEKNIPLDETKECVWEENACQEKTKQCKGSDFTNDNDCWGLAVSDSNKICVSNNKQCIEQYKSMIMFPIKKRKNMNQ